MPTVTLDELYDQQIRKLPLPDRLDLARRILNEAAGEEEGGRARSLLELEGLGAELWGAVDAQDYVSRLRQEWDRRP
jgi:hypothetical protein